MFVLGIDPGLTRCGYGLVGVDPDKPGRYLARSAGVIETNRASSTPERLAVLHAELVALVDELSPSAVAVERVFFQTNVRTAIAVAQAAGVALMVAVEADLEVVEYTANEVKLAVTGVGNASKADMQQMVATLTGLTGPLDPPDVADAMGLAICHLLTAPTRKALAKATGARR
ncbi:MAG: crossover junction endodeoxyribonuclease RuvC [Actinobacteria bacterium]|nr:crossover junction endodeoxyribonuclease RuvC [Actinomycetota bacterium]